MKHITFLLKRSSQTVCIILLMLLIQIPSALAQELDIEKSIEEHRKGKITVKAGPDSKVVIEQLSHEFLVWLRYWEWYF